MFKSNGGVFLLLILLLTNTLNQFILFSTSHFVKEMVKCLLYIIILKFALHNYDFLTLYLACILTSNVRILVNHSKCTSKPFYTIKNKVLISNLSRSLEPLKGCCWYLRRNVLMCILPENSDFFILMDNCHFELTILSYIKHCINEYY